MCNLIQSDVLGQVTSMQAILDSNSVHVDTVTGRRHPFGRHLTDEAKV